MNKIAICACTFVALSWQTSTALADSYTPFDIMLKGDAFFTTGYVHQNADVGMQTVEVMNQFRLNVIPTATADNGLTYGARMRLRASLSSGLIDADLAYLFARGSFGTVELGTQFDPNMVYHVIAPSNFGTGGIDGDWAIGSVGWIQNQLTFLEPYFGGGYTVTTFVKEANRVNYLTPRLFSDGARDKGLLAWGSYAPANRDVFTAVRRSFVNTDAVGNHPYGYGKTTAFSNCLGAGAPLGCNYRDVYELGWRYDQTLAGIRVSGGASRIAGSTVRINFGTPQSFYDLTAWQAGLQLGFGGFLIGGSYLNAGRSAYPQQSLATGRLYQEDQYTWTAGLSYETGPIAIGFNYQSGHDAGDLTVPGARTANLYAVGITYQLAPGLSTALEAMRSTTHNETGFVSDPLGFRAVASGNADLFLWKTQVTF